jgi:hypothetical protein
LLLQEIKEKKSRDRKTVQMKKINTMKKLTKRMTAKKTIRNMVTMDKRAITKKCPFKNIENSLQIFVGMGRIRKWMEEFKKTYEIMKFINEQRHKK